MMLTKQAWCGRWAGGACVVLLGILAWFGLPLLAGDDKATPSAQEKAAHLERMRQLAASIKVYEFTGEQQATAKLVDRPVLAYRDDTRKQHDSTMWIFGVPPDSKTGATASGRPSAMIAIEHYPNNIKSKEWLFEIASLATGQIAADRDPELHWRARQPGLDLKGLDGAPAPADKPAARLAQMRDLRRRFAAHEREGSEGRIQLQPLSAPLYRYQDASRGVIDGAVFAFASGTNPEVLWIIEAHGQPGTVPSWQFGLAQMTGAAVFVALDEKEIWKRDDADPPAVRDSYVNGWMAASAAGK